MSSVRRVDNFTLSVRGSSHAVRVAQSWMGTDSAEQWQQHIDTWAHFVCPGDVALDVGANRGDTSVPLALLTAGGTRKRNGAVHAFEPHPRVFKVLKAQATQNPWLPLRPHNFAAGVQDGDFLYHSGCDGCNGGQLRPGDAARKKGVLKLKAHALSPWLERTLSSAEAPRLRFVKVDAEGFDWQVIDALRPYLERYRGGRHAAAGAPPPPVLWAEWYRGYRSLWAGAGTWVQCSPGTRQLLASARAAGYEPHTLAPAGDTRAEGPSWARWLAGHPAARLRAARPGYAMPLRFVPLAGCANWYGTEDLLLLPNATRGGWQPRDPC